MFKPKNTNDASTDFNKVLLYAIHGWGKTTQAMHYQKRYGPGFIISGESGLKSVRTAGIDYLPFTTWDGGSDPDKDIYSFKDILRWVNTPAFQAKGYKWIMIDSLTELSDLAYIAADTKAEADAKAAGKPLNGFAVWEEYGSMMIGACKWVRDLPMHVIVTALAKEDEDENGNKAYWPMVKGKAVQKQLPGIFDFVLCGVKRHIGDIDPVNNQAVVKPIRYVITDQYKGWHGKARDEKRRLSAVEREDDITKLFDKMEMADSDYETYQKQRQTGGQ